MDGEFTASATHRTVADRYQLRDLIGRGGMADVFSATDLVLDRPVAIKMLRDGMDEPTNRLRFAHEANTLAQLSHRGLVRLFDAALEDGQPFIVLELVEGQSLSRRLAERGPLDLELATSIGEQLAEALAYAHSRGVVHRDVKPGNVLVEDDGRVKLADFGIARLIDDNVHHTRTGEAIGTAAYLSPEQVTGRPVTGAADIYALGLLLLEALTGKQTYPGSAAEAALARLSRPPVIPASLPATWQTLLSEMTQLHPEDRPEAVEVARRLRGDGDTASHLAAPAEESTSLRRNGRAPLVAACAVLVTLVLAVAVVGRLDHQGASASPADPTSGTAAPPAQRTTAGQDRHKARTRVVARSTQASTHPPTRPTGHRTHTADVRRTTHRGHPAHRRSHRPPGHAKPHKKGHRHGGRPAEPHGPPHPHH